MIIPPLDPGVGWMAKVFDLAYVGPATLGEAEILERQTTARGRTSAIGHS